MKFQFVSIALLVSLMLAGCASDSGVSLDFITPGQWHVSGDTDHILVWAHNSGADSIDFTWNLTGAGGAALPANWTVSFEEDSGTLHPDGTKMRGARGYEYTDWARTLVTITVPEDEPGGTHAVELHAAGAVRKATLLIAANRTDVSGPGDSITVSYEGRFTDNGEVFDDGSFPTTLGSGQTVPGFDYGLMGLAKGEKATLVIPAAYGYGYDIPAGNRLADFNGRSLTFEVQITKLD